MDVETHIRKVLASQFEKKLLERVVQEASPRWGHWQREYDAFSPSQMHNRSNHLHYLANHLPTTAWPAHEKLQSGDVVYLWNLGQHVTMEIVQKTNPAVSYTFGYYPDIAARSIVPVNTFEACVPACGAQLTAIVETTLDKWAADIAYNKIPIRHGCFLTPDPLFTSLLQQQREDASLCYRVVATQPVFRHELVAADMKDNRIQTQLLGGCFQSRALRLKYDDGDTSHSPSHSHMECMEYPYQYFSAVAFPTHHLHNGMSMMLWLCEKLNQENGKIKGGSPIITTEPKPVLSQVVVENRATADNTADIIDTLDYNYAHNTLYRLAHATPEDIAAFKAQSYMELMKPITQSVAGYVRNLLPPLPCLPGGLHGTSRQKRARRPRRASKRAHARRRSRCRTRGCRTRGCRTHGCRTRGCRTRRRMLRTPAHAHASR
jgi:hypothetical protein